MTPERLAELRALPGLLGRTAVSECLEHIDAQAKELEDLRLKLRHSQACTDLAYAHADWTRPGAACKANPLSQYRTCTDHRETVAVMHQTRLGASPIWRMSRGVLFG